MGLWIDGKLSFISHASAVSVSLVKFWKRDIKTCYPGNKPILCCTYFSSLREARVTYRMPLWFQKNEASLNKMWCSINKSICDVKNLQVSKYVLGVINNIWSPHVYFVSEVLNLVSRILASQSSSSHDVKLLPYFSEISQRFPSYISMAMQVETQMKQ